MSGTARGALEGTLVVELGRRTGASMAASLLAQLGATVVVELPPAVQAEPGSLSDKWNWRGLMLAGKQACGDAEALRAFCDRADAVITSSDVGPACRWRVPDGQVVCDVTAWGGDAASPGDCELQMQARTGILVTTGPSDGDPLPVPVPLLESLAGMNAAGAVLAALRHVRRTGLGQRIDIALFDCGFAAMSSFFSRLLVEGGGGAFGRLGNRHTLSAPWNVYRARDGWLLVCTGSDEQWRRLCCLMGRADLAVDPRLQHSEDRVARVAEVDACVQAWVATQTVAACVQSFERGSIPGGPIAEVDGFPHEPNLRHRGMVQPLGVEGAWMAGSPLRMSRTPGRAAASAPLPVESADRAAARPAHADGPAEAEAADAGPLDGIRVVEIGHYTTAPIAARHLAALGAVVVKVEPPGGEAARGWAPMHQGQSVFYTVSNSDKDGVSLDLTQAAGRAALRELLRDADVLIENLKPGTLAKNGFDPEALQHLNPRLVACAISGFGADSIYASRPAFDTVVQAMSGLMDRIRRDAVPYKTGTSTADVMGAAMAVVAVLGALQERERSGLGQFIDLSMQDIVAWATQTAWSGEPAMPPVRFVRCADGLLLVLGRGELPSAEALASFASLSREAAEARLREGAFRVAPVRLPAEVVRSPHALARRLHFRVRDGRGEWPALAIPMRLSRTPPAVRRPGPPLGAHNRELAPRVASHQETEEA